MQFTFVSNVAHILQKKLSSVFSHLGGAFFSLAKPFNKDERRDNVIIDKCDSQRVHKMEVKAFIFYGTFFICEGMNVNKKERS